MGHHGRMDSDQPSTGNGDTPRLAHRRLRILGAVLAVAAFALVGLTVGRGGIATNGPVVADHRPWFSIGSGSGSDALVGGTLELEGECLLLSGNPVVWPSGTSWDPETQVLSVTGRRAELGDRVYGGGAVRGEQGDGGWDATDAGRATADCRQPGSAVVVLNRDDEVTVS